MTRRKANAGVKEPDVAVPATGDIAHGEGPPDPDGLVEEGVGAIDPFDVLDKAANDELNDLLVGLAHTRRSHSPRYRVLD